jgi:hypothetical protein
MNSWTATYLTMIENDSLRHKRERAFQASVLAALEKPKENRVWAFLNKPFTLWFLSLILLTVGGSYFSAYRQCQQDAYTQIDQFQKLRRELLERESHIRQIINGYSTIAAMREQLSLPYFFYPEYKDYPLGTIRDAYSRYSQRIINFKDFRHWRDLTPETAKFSDVENAQISGAVTDDDIPALQRFVRLPLAALLVSSMDFSPFLFAPACRPSALYQRAIKGEPARIVQSIDYSIWETQ